MPEINGQETKKSKLIANPNCTTAIGLMALWPLYKAFGLKKVFMSTYQAASGAGQPGMDELMEGTAKYLAGEKVENKIFAHPLPFNVIPVRTYGVMGKPLRLSRRIISLFFELST